MPPLRSTRLVLALFSIASVIGCGGGPENAAPATGVVIKGPHGGILSKLPDDQGYVEVISEPDGATRSRVRFAAYYLKPDRVSAIDSIPEAVVYTPQGGGKPLKLASDAKGSGRAVSEPIAAGGSGTIGDISAKLGGGAVSVSVVVTPKP